MKERDLKKPNIASKIELKVEATVNPSEDAQKVIEAIANLFTRCSPEVSYRSRAVGRAVGSDSLAYIIRAGALKVCDGCAEEDALGQSSRR